MIDFEHDEQVQAHEVRLFPPIRISSEREAEQRATAALLAIVKGVSEFGRAVMRIAGGPAGRINCYTEVSFPPLEPDGPRPRPDGVIRAVRGNKEWKALVEVKVGDSPLEQEQFDCYQRLAREHAFDAIITISSQAATLDGLPPLNVDGRRLRAVPAVHLSWDRLLSEARMLSQQQGVTDSDQDWLLKEWIRYVADPNSKIVEPPQLGKHWGEVIKAAREANLPSVAKYVDDLVRCWEDFLKKEALRLRAKLGVDVQQRVPLRERQDLELRVRRLYSDVLERGRLTGELRIPDTAGDVTMELGLQAQVIRFAAELQPPSEGRQLTRLNWLIKQLRDEQTPPELIVKVEWDRKGLLSQAQVTDAVREHQCLLRDGHNQPIPADAMPRRFLVEWTRPLRKGRGRSTAPILEGISEDLEAFYGRVLERLVAYVAPAPKLPKEGPSHEPEVAPAVDPQPAAEAPIAASPDAAASSAEFLVAGEVAAGEVAS